jgi:hypothetical protein
MSKKDFIAVADAIRGHNNSNHPQPFTDEQLDVLAGAMSQINPRFNWQRWFGYIKGINGPNGGKI